MWRILITCFAFVMFLSIHQTTWTTDTSRGSCTFEIIPFNNKPIVNMNCSNLRLTDLPIPPESSRNISTRVTLDFNNFSSLNQSQLDLYSHYKIIILSLKRTNLVYISKYAFRNMKQLRHLDLSENLIPVNVLKNAFKGLRFTRIGTLIISSMGLQQIPDDFFEPLKNKKLNLTFENNTQDTFPAEAFMKVEKLLSLNFGDNQMTKLQFCNVSFPSITHFKLDNNLLDEFPDFCCGLPTTPFPNLSNLSIQWNSMRTINRKHYNCLKKMYKLHLNGNIFSKLETNQFASLPVLYELKLSYVGCALQQTRYQATPPTIQRAVFNNTSLRKIFFRQNHVYFKKEEMDMRIFEGCTNLNLLNLNQNMFGKTQEDDYEILFKGLQSLEYLIMTDCQLPSIPRAITRLLTNLKSLALYSNAITGWEDHTFDNLTKLTKLFMAKNKITSLTEKSFPQRFVQNAAMVELCQNNFACSCDLLWFINWLKSNPKTFECMKGKYICSNAGTFHGQRLVDVQLSETTCLIGMEVKVTTLSFSIILIVLLIVGAVIYRYRWQIQYIIYIIRYSQRPEVDTREYTYDVFVAYSAEDRWWVIKILLPILEGKENLKLCIHDRDFEAGKLIVDNIADGIESSRKILIVLSNTFAKSNWCQFEMNLIQTHVLEHRQNLLVVILLEDIESRNMTKALKAMLETTTYLLWGPEDYAIQAFYNRLRLLLQKPMIHGLRRRSSL